jgi:predicted nucleotidyltransferase
MNDQVQGVLRRLKTELAAIYGARLRGVYLFGSHARGEADEESDVDVLIVLDRVDNYSAEIERTGEIVSRLSLEHDLTISRVFTSEERWQSDQTMFLLNVREEAVAI